MNLKQNKGYVGTDVAIAVLILLIFIPTIMGMVYNISATRSATNIKSGATNIAVNAIETAKGINLLELTEKKVIEELKNDVYVALEIDETNQAQGIITIGNTSYRIAIEVEDYADNKEGIEFNLVKTVKATVTYKIRGEEKSIDISTVVQ